MKNGQIFDLAKTPKTTEKHQNHYKNTHFSSLCWRKNCILKAYAGVRSFCSSCILAQKNTLFTECFFYYGCRRFKTAIQLHQHMLVQTVDKLAALAAVGKLAAVQAVVAVQAVAVVPFELADY